MGQGVLISEGIPTRERDQRESKLCYVIHTTQYHYIHSHVHSLYHNMSTMSTSLNQVRVLTEFKESLMNIMCTLLYITCTLLYAMYIYTHILKFSVYNMSGLLLAHFYIASVQYISVKFSDPIHCQRNTTPPRQSFPQPSIYTQQYTLPYLVGR